MLTDTELQQRLSSTFHEAADPLGAVPISGTADIFRRGRRRRAASGALVALTIAAVAAVTAGALAVIPAGRHGPGPATGSAPAVTAGMPRFYVALSTASIRKMALQVNDSRTGKLLSTLSLAKEGAEPGSRIAATGDGRTFVLALAHFPLMRFYQLRVSADGRSTSLAPMRLPALPITDGRGLAQMAVSPDRSQIALALFTSYGDNGLINVVSLASGAARTWRPSRAPGFHGLPWNLHWMGNRRLAFFWQASPRPVMPIWELPRSSGLLAIDTSTAGGDLLSARVILPGKVGDDIIMDAVPAPDGKTAIAAVEYASVTHPRRGTVVDAIVEFSMRTGRPLRTLLVGHAVTLTLGTRSGWYPTYCSIGAADPSRSHLLLACDHFGRLDAGVFTSLPLWARSEATTGVAW